MNLIIINSAIYVITVILIIVALYTIRKITTKNYKVILDNLEIEKNVIDSVPIMAEITKIRSFLRNDKLDDILNEWEDKFKNIRNNHIPKVTDMILEAEYSLAQNDYKAIIYKIAKLEMELYKIKVSSDNLLGEIKEITTSEERNRAIMTKFKSTYRELYERFNVTKKDYGEVTESIVLQFENIAKRFELFEVTMENNDYQEVTKIIKSIDEMLKHMEIVLEEVPSIVLMACNILPLKIKEINDMYYDMKKSGYPLDYLNVEYNIEEANKKIIEVLKRTTILDLEDSLFELKVLIDYIDSLFIDFEKEVNDRKVYHETNSLFKKKIEKIKTLVDDIFVQMDHIKSVYDLSQKDITFLEEVKVEVDKLNKDYEILINHTANNTFAYSKLIKEIESLNVRLNFIEERMDSSLDALDNMKEDELRARQQLDEVREILKISKLKMRDYNLPVIPKYYYTELNEAAEAIKEIVKELDKKPIVIKTLNTRVDTARDLALKLYGRTKELLKNARFAELAIVYGNRYRYRSEEIDKTLNNSEILFNRGEYQKSLEATIVSLNKMEPGIYNRLLKLYDK